MAKIMLIDDSQDLSHLTKVALSKKGYEVSIFHDAPSAIKQLKEQKPDLILMDIILPQLSGAEAVKVLRKDPVLADIPVIFLTGLISNMEEDLEKSGINIDGCIYPTLGKPYEIETLLELIERALK